MMTDDETETKKLMNLFESYVEKWKDTSMSTDEAFKQIVRELKRAGYDINKETFDLVQKQKELDDLEERLSEKAKELQHQEETLDKKRESLKEIQQKLDKREEKINSLEEMDDVVEKHKSRIDDLNHNLNDMINKIRNESVGIDISINGDDS